MLFSKMKDTDFFIFLTVFFLLSGPVFPQESDNKGFWENGKPILRVFSNFHTGISEGNDNSAFEIRRAYLGYQNQLSENFMVLVKLDIGSPEDLSEFSLLRRYAYFKNAALRFSMGKFRSHFGIVDAMQFRLQESFWDHRYVYKSFQDEHRFGASADLGWNIVYRMNRYVSADFSVMNGEGYTQLQTDNTYKGALGISLYPVESLTLRVYYDLMACGVSQQTIAAFAGYRMHETLALGVEYNVKINEDHKDGHNRDGYSVYGYWNFFREYQVFLRYDFIRSSVTEQDGKPWDLVSDGSAFVGGIQYMPIQNIRIALNYQDWYPYAGNLPNKSYLYLNLEYKL